MASAYSATAPQRWTYVHCDVAHIHFVFPQPVGDKATDIAETEPGSGVIVLPGGVRPMLTAMSSPTYIAWVESELKPQKAKPRHNPHYV